MLCPFCARSARRFGRNRNGTQRHRCDVCRRPFTDDDTRPTDRRQLPFDRLVMCLRLILEGMSIRAAERLTGTHRDTIIRSLVTVGQQCQRFLEETIREVPVQDVQCDEVWSFVMCKGRTRERWGHSEEFGDAYCFTAIEQKTKLMLTWELGKRDNRTTAAFARKLRRAVSGDFQLTTDGYRPYSSAIPLAFGYSLDYAQLIKNYANPAGGEGRYSPPEILSIHTNVICGTPDPDRVCTSHVERSNLTLRMTLRRYTRLTNAFSKKLRNHGAALGLFFAYYNFCRVHQTLTERNHRKTTPAMAAKFADHVWSVQELVESVSRS